MKAVSCYNQIRNKGKGGSNKVLQITWKKPLNCSEFTCSSNSDIVST